jgi:phosphoribosylanthranilate isomerase
MQIKICGITNLEDAQAAARAGADYIGLVRVPGPRRVELAAASEIAAAMPSTTAAVLLFRNAPLEEIRAAVEATSIRCVQLHGDEPIAFTLDLLQSLPEVRCIRAFEVHDEAAAEGIRKYLAGVRAAGLALEAVILDSPKSGPHPGYPCLGAVAQRCRDLTAALWLAGGLTPENVAHALAAGPFDGADVSRGVEARPGHKNHDAIDQFATRARNARHPSGL